MLSIIESQVNASCNYINVFVCSKRSCLLDKVAVKNAGIDKILAHQFYFNDHILKQSKANLTRFEVKQVKIT